VIASVAYEFKEAMLNTAGNLLLGTAVAAGDLSSAIFEVNVCRNVKSAYSSCLTPSPVNMVPTQPHTSAPTTRCFTQRKREMSHDEPRMMTRFACVARWCS